MIGWGALAPYYRISIEARPELGEGYASVASLFKQFELIYLDRITEPARSPGDAVDFPERIRKALPSGDR